MAETYQKIEQERDKLRREFAVLVDGGREMSVTRYNFEVASQFKITDQIVYVEARPSKNGKYVRYSGYAAIRSRVTRLEEALNVVMARTEHSVSPEIYAIARRALEGK